MIGNDAMQQFIQDALEAIEYQPVRLLDVLIKCQAHFQHVPRAAIDSLAAALQLPRAQIIAVIEFYSFLHLKPQGQYQILLSDSTTVS